MLEKIINKIKIIINRTNMRFLMLVRKLIFNKVHPRWREYYNLIDHRKIKELKTSDTIFIFGSGYSINNITNEEFKYFEKHDTLSFNWFLHQNFLKIKFHLVRELVYDTKDIFDLNRKIESFKSFMQKEYYKNTVYLLQNDLLAETPFELLRRFVFPEKYSIYFFKTYSRRKDAFPAKDISKGLIHSAGTLTDCISFAYSMGYKKIVLVGIDLYDRRYFWLKENETREGDVKRNSSYKDKHNTANPMINVVKIWNKKFKEENVQMYVYNEKSLLADFLPVFKKNVFEIKKD